jgi:hypothetical protein
MKYRIPGILAAVLCCALAWTLPARAQPMQVVPSCGSITLTPGMGTGGTIDTTGRQCSNPGSGASGAANVTLVPPTGTPNQTTVTCGVASTTLLAAAAATSFILIKNPAAGGVVWLNFAGVAAVAAPPSLDMSGGGSVTWSAAQGFLPSSQINCIAPVAQAVELVWK